MRRATLFAIGPIAAAPAAHAGKLGEHPAVIVKRGAEEERLAVPKAAAIELARR